jgi:hypothetical protein
MKHLDNINPNKFYAELVNHGHLIEEVVEGVDQDGNWSSYHDFEDAIIDAEHEEVKLNEYGNAKYFFEGKIYDVVVFLENYEGCAINELELEEIHKLIDELRIESKETGYSESDFLNKEPWVKKFINSTLGKTMTFHGNMGELKLKITGTKATGTYQGNGTLDGFFLDNTFKGQWKNKGMEGLVQFTILNNKLEGTWKKGLEAGPMKGKWEGDLQNGTDIEEKSNGAQNQWNIIYDIFAFYTFFSNLTDGGIKEIESRFVLNDIQKWQFKIDGVDYGLKFGNPSSFAEMSKAVFDALYVDDKSVSKNPFIQMDISHGNIAKYFNDGILDCISITTLFSSIQKLCELGGVSENQDNQLRWYVEQWIEVCPETEIVLLALDLGKNQSQTIDEIEIEKDPLYSEAKEIILSEGAALPEILCDVLLIGKNRAERIFEQFEIDGIVTPKDEYGNRKIIL